MFLSGHDFAADRLNQETNNRKRRNSVAHRPGARRVYCRVNFWEGSMRTWQEDEASATDRIVDLKTGETVGFVYQWRDGKKQPLWFFGQRENVIYIGLGEEEAHSTSG